MVTVSRDRTARLREAAPSAERRTGIAVLKPDALTDNATRGEAISPSPVCLSDGFSCYFRFTRLTAFDVVVVVIVVVVVRVGMISGRLLVACLGL